MTRFFLVISTLVFVALLKYVHGAPMRQTRQVTSFLLKFGYLTEGNNSKSREAINPTSEQFQRSIRNLQRFANIPVTGRIDAATIQLINTDRCGVKDRLPNAVGEFKLQGTSWKKRDITYKIISFTTDGIPRYLQRRIFRKAFNLWQAASDLRVREVYSGDADILISFVRQTHNDPYPFDGEGGTLAHAFYPHDNKGLSGDAHFDEDERFTTGTKDGINLDWVAVHEFGHSLGLEHSNVRESIMYPWYKGYVPIIKLTNDDVRGIQTLYPKPTKPIRTTPLLATTKRPQVTPRPVLNVCRSTFRYDSVFVDRDKKTYFFVGEHFWYLDRRLRRTGPLMIRRYWKHVRTPVDAAYLNRRGHLTFFKGSQFWEYNNRRTLTNYGTIARYGLPMDLANMDAVFTWEGNKKTYFFKGSKYWRYDEQTRRADTSRYPRNIRSAWRISHRFDAAVTWINGRSFIFRGRQYFKLRKGRVHLEPGYPKAIADGWMRCSTRGRLLDEAGKSGDRSEP